MKNTCKNCIYFNFSSRHKLMGVCKNIHFAYGFPDDDNLDDYVKENKEKCLLFFDFEGYNADLLVGENFGCIYWKDKSTQRYIVLLECDKASDYYVYLTDGEGDPPRTLVKENAQLFATLEDALKALRKAQNDRPFKNAKVLEVYK